MPAGPSGQWTHENAALWSLDTRTLRVTRMASAPYGAAVSSVGLYRSVGFWSYLSFVMSHPYRDTGRQPLTGVNARAMYVGPYPLTAGADSLSSCPVMSGTAVCVAWGTLAPAVQKLCTRSLVVRGLQAGGPHSCHRLNGPANPPVLL